MAPDADPSPAASTERGVALAESHLDRLVDVATVDEPTTLIDYAERTRVGDWSLRSALVRFAQPDPTRVSAVLELIRRTDGALHPVRRALEKHLVEVANDGVDIRMADLARRRVADEPTFDAFLTGYESRVPIDDVERDTIRLLGVAVILDGLAESMAVWAEDRSAGDPASVIDAAGRVAFAELESLGVPRETGPVSSPRGRGLPRTGRATRA